MHPWIIPALNIFNPFESVQGFLFFRFRVIIIHTKISKQKGNLSLMIDSTVSAARGEKTKYRLAESMKECMKTTPVEEITVRQICEICGVTRQTFYRNFLDKYDLINWYFDKLLAKSFEHMGRGTTVFDSLEKKFTYIQEEKNFFAAAFRYDKQNSLREHDFELILAFYENLIREKAADLRHRKCIFSSKCTARDRLP